MLTRRAYGRHRLSDKLVSGDPLGEVTSRRALSLEAACSASMRRFRPKLSRDSLDSSVVKAQEAMPTRRCES